MSNCIDALKSLKLKMNGLVVYPLAAYERGGEKEK